MEIFQLPHLKIGLPMPKRFGRSSLASRQCSSVGCYIIHQRERYTDMAGLPILLVNASSQIGNLQCSANISVLIRVEVDQCAPRGSHLTIGVSTENSHAFSTPLSVVLLRTGGAISSDSLITVEVDNRTLQSCRMVIQNCVKQYSIVDDAERNSFALQPYKPPP
jgi:hypothetical protein